MRMVDWIGLEDRARVERELQYSRYKCQLHGGKELNKQKERQDEHKKKIEGENGVH